MLPPPPSLSPLSDDHTTRDLDTSAVDDASRSRPAAGLHKRQISFEDGASSGGGLKRAKTLPASAQSGGGGSGSLFAKLVERAGPVLSSHPSGAKKAPAVASGAPTSAAAAAKKLLLAGRIRSN
jgi:hypothetical protein